MHLPCLCYCSRPSFLFFCFFFNDTATTEIYTLSLHDALPILRWPKYWSFSFSISPSSEHTGLISFRMDWLDLLAFQGTLKSLLVVPDSYTELPRNVAFETAPTWLAISPSGYCGFNTGFKEMQASSFDKVMNGSSPRPVGDIVLRVLNKPYTMCLDIDRASGKIRRNHFINDEP